PADTWGIVIERQRRPDERDEIVWFCPDGHELHRRTFALADIETELAAILEEFNDSPALRTCATCGQVLEVPGPFVLDVID
ncbi:MAG: 3-hydroxyanthranilate 3,4-dioxygenase, partial [Acidimicrobiia bacterium]|nr:3-hydroxyanthranilate 3,4-dioxygenase [Acidimicrobiia bacterium]